MADSLREQILALADELRGGDADDNDLGFVDMGSDTEFVFLNRQEFDHGHMIDENDDPVPLPGDAMAGYIDDAYYTFREHETYGLSQKLRVVLDTEPGRIMMEAGFFTNTSKSLLSNLANLQDPGALVTIEPSLPDNPDESPNVLFTEIYESGELIQGTNGDWPHEDEEVIELFNYVREEVFGFEPQDVEPQLPDRSLFGGNGPGDGRAPNGHASDNRDGNERRESNRPASHGNGARSQSRRRSA